MDLADLARANRRQILKCILRDGGVARSDIARSTGLANSTVTEIVYRLMEKRILVTRELRRNGRRGRPALVLSLDPEGSLVVVADYSDVEARAHLTGPTGRIVRTETNPLPEQPSLAQYVAASVRAVERVGRGEWRNVQGITVIGPGVVDPDRGLLLQNSHFGWGAGKFVQPFRRFGKQIFLQNGARLRAVAENWYGAAVDCEDFLYFHLDRGIGGAIVLNGSLIEGPSHGAGEFGHIVVEPGGPSCACGARGCLEAIASVPAVVGALRRSGCSTLASAWDQYRRGTRTAVDVFKRAAAAIARSMLNAAITVGPKTVLVGGEMVDVTEGRIITLIRQRLDGQPSFLGSIELRACRLPESHSQVLGATVYALQELDLEE